MRVLLSSRVYYLTMATDKDTLSKAFWVFESQVPLREVMSRTELSFEVKGYLADLIAKESLGRLEIIGMRFGINPEII